MENENQAAVMNHALALLEDGTLRIADDGRIWRHKIISHGAKMPIEPRLSECVDSRGYFRIVLGKPGKKSTYHVQAHRLVWTWFKGPIPEGMKVNHKDCNKQNNRLENLELMTNQENMDHAVANGFGPWHDARNKPRAGRFWRGRPMFTESQRREVIELRGAGLLLRDVSERCGISMSHVSRICQEGRSK